MSSQVKDIVEIGEWLVQFGLDVNLKDYLRKFGIEDVDDLQVLFADMSLLQKCKAGMAPEDFPRFGKAFQKYMIDMQDDDITVKIVTKAETSSHGSSSSTSSRKRQLQSEENASVEDKRSRRIAVVDKNLTKSASLDLLIMLDCTTSMGAYIHAAKTRIRSLVKTIGEIYPDIPLRIGFIGYRDIRDGPDRLVSLPFQNDLSFLEGKLSEIECFGGGNPLTDLTGALRVAASFDWASAIRMLFHIGDYPCHGVQYHSGVKDAYLAGDPNGFKPEVFVKGLAEMKVRYCFGQLTHHTDKMINLFNEHVGHEYIKSAPMNSTTVIEVISSSITALLTTTLSSSSSTDSFNAKPRDCALVQEMPRSWPAVRTERAISFSLINAVSVASLCEEGNQNVVGVFPDDATVFTKCAQHPFGSGKSKLAYYAHASKSLADSVRAVSESPIRVLKQSAFSSRSHNSKEKFEEYLAPQRAALHLASVYAKERPADSPHIQFVAARLLQFLARPDKPFFIEENYIPGVWERFNNNTGYCAPCPTPLGTDHSAVQAFSHWTHHVSDGRLMVTDCQGSYNAARNTFVLTDPAVHCVSLLAYGGTNMGTKGFERFFKTHRCNDVCRALGLLPHAFLVDA